MTSRGSASLSIWPGWSSSLGPLPQAPQLETKLIADAVKFAAYDAHAWLADRLAQHCRQPHDFVTCCAPSPSSEGR